MNARTTARTIAGAAAVLALAGGGVAYAASGDSSEPKPPERPAAPGLALDPGEHRIEVGPGAPGLALGGPFDGVADYLGLTEEELRERVNDGRSLADIARAEGKSVDGLEDAIVAAAKERLDRAVDEGWMPARVRDRILERLRENVDELVQQTGPRFGFRGFHRDGAPGKPPGGRCVPFPDEDERGRSERPDAGGSGGSDEGSSADPSSQDDSAGASERWQDAPAASVWS